MSTQWTFGRDYSAVYGGLMIGLGTALGVLGSMMSNPIREQVAYASATILTALCLLIAILFLGIPESRSLPRHFVRVHLLVGALSTACCLVYWLLQSAFMDLHVLGIVAALHGLFWGAWYMRIAFHLRTSFTKALVLCILAAATSSFGIVLATRPGANRFSCVTLVGCYTMGLGILIFVTAALLPRSYAKDRVPASR
jgi:hypothetical protein